MPSKARLKSQYPLPTAAGGVGSGFIDGLIISWVSATSISVSNGAAYIPSTGTPLVVPSTLTLSGLTLSVSSWQHVYLYDNAGTAAIEIVTTAPATPYSGKARAKTGDTSRRYLGSMKTDASGNLYKCSFGTDNRVQYLIHTSGAPLQVIADGVSTTPVTVSCTAAVPVTATRIELDVISTNSTGVSLYFSNSDIGTLSSSLFLQGYVTPLNFYTVLPLNSAQAFTVLYGGVPNGNLLGRLTAYNFER